ncbi:Tim44/TimA family putative adaptor protein [Rhodovibrionaceae bacterium A322]
MGDFLDIILFAAIAAFLVFRLRSVLGSRDGHDAGQEFDPFKQREERAEKARQDAEEDKVIHLPNARGESAKTDATAQETAAGTSASQKTQSDPLSSDPLSAGLTQIRLADGSFDPEGFVQGARAAFEMILLGFAKGDQEVLRPLLADDVFADFSKAMEQRADAGETMETTLVSLDKGEIIEAELQGKTAFVTVKLVSEQMNVTRDAEGEVVDGDPHLVAKVTDIWTFARNTRSRDPNWTLVSTRSVN